MRQKNWRAVIVGMLTIAPRSTYPAALMQTVGTVSGAVGGLSLVMIIFGLIGKK
jgi:phage-related minor tail protein